MMNDVKPAQAGGASRQPIYVAQRSLAKLDRFRWI